jgi:hypothetical protein
MLHQDWTFVNGRVYQLLEFLPVDEVARTRTEARWVISPRMGGFAECSMSDRCSLRSWWLDVGVPCRCHLLESSAKRTVIGEGFTCDSLTTEGTTRGAR